MNFSNNKENLNQHKEKEMLKLFLDWYEEEIAKQGEILYERGKEKLRKRQRE